MNKTWKLQKKSHSTLRAKQATFTFWVDKSWNYTIFPHFFCKTREEEKQCGKFNFSEFWSKFHNFIPFVKVSKVVNLTLKKWKVLKTMTKWKPIHFLVTCKGKAHYIFPCIFSSLYWSFCFSRKCAHGWAFTLLLLSLLRKLRLQACSNFLRETDREILDVSVVLICQLYSITASKSLWYRASDQTWSVQGRRAHA